MSVAYWLTGDTRAVLAQLPAGCVDGVVTSSPYMNQRTYLPEDHPDKGSEIGTESGPATFVESLLEVADVMHRVMAPHAVAFWNLGDSAAFSGGSGGDYNEGGLREGQARYEGTASKARHAARWSRTNPEYPLPKSRCWVPELFGASLAYGRNILTGTEHEQWVTRRHIVWCKENPTPGELIDAPRDATESVVMFTKGGDYFYDLDVQREEREYDERRVKTAAYAGHPKSKLHGTRPDQANHPLGAPPLSWWKMGSQPWKGQNGDHYAVMPPALVAKCLAGMPERICVDCGVPWERIIACGGCGAEGGTSYNRTFRRTCICPKDQERKWTRTERWLSCCCGSSTTRRALILDPFGGSGTTGLVATGHGRDAILVDLDSRNLELAHERLGMFLSETTPTDLSAHLTPVPALTASCEAEA